MSQGVHLEFEAENQIGFKDDATVVIKEKAQKTLHKYDLQHQEGNVYQKIWNVDFPLDVNDASIRSVSYSFPQDSYVLLQDKNTATLKLSFDCRSVLDSPESWNSWHYEGIILPCSRIDRVYAVEKTDGEYEIIINDNNFNARLQPVAGRPSWKDPYLSVCVNGVRKDRIAVASSNHTLDIYNIDSKYIQLTFYHAVVHHGLKSSFNDNHNVYH